MNIAVLFGEIGFISRYKIIEGIRDWAEQDNANIVLYTCEGFLYEELEDYIAGEYNIFSLPELSNYDGVIVDLDSIQDEETAENLKTRIEESKIPCVSFDKYIENADVISFDNEIGFKKLLQHLIKDHNIKDIIYMSGPKKNRDADQRRKVFDSVMAENGIHIPDENIFVGDFNFESGRQMIRELLASGRSMPQAFVAANDYMAIGIMHELMKAGIDIPGQVIVTGYDNCDLVELTRPRLTTVDRGEFKAGQLAYDSLKEKINGAVGSRSYILEGSVVVADSCGCKPLTPKQRLVNPSVDTQISMDSSLDLLKSLSISFSDMENLAEFEQCMEKYISRMGMDFFYFCQCGSRSSYYNDLELWASGKNVLRDISKFQEKAWCPIAYEAGEWNSYSSFDIKNLFPPNSKYKKENSYYIVMPVHQGKVCIGYSIIGNFRNRYSGRVIQHLVLNIDQAIGNIRKQDIMKTMLAKINKQWQYDELTKIYNRSGMRAQAEVMIEEAKKRNTGIAVIFFDLDGLKKINDTMGHKAGDNYIKLMADGLLAAVENDDIVARYGGDEYIFLTQQTSLENAQMKFERVKSYIGEDVFYSAGLSFDRVYDFQGLKCLIEEADGCMYEAKKMKK